MEPFDNLDDLIKKAVKTEPVPQPASNFSFSVIQKIEKARIQKINYQPLIPMPTFFIVFVIFALIILSFLFFLPEHPKETTLFNSKAFHILLPYMQVLKSFTASITVTPFLTPILIAFLLQLVVVKKLFDKILDKYLQRLTK